MEVGQQVKVCRLRDRVPAPVIKRLGEVGTIKGFKVLDGRSLGIVVEFEDKFATWFFEDELRAV